MTPKVKELYAKYSNSGLEIIGVSSDDDSQKWLRAIDEHNLTEYPHVLSSIYSKDGYAPFFRNQSDIGDLYGIEYLPSYILIDKSGKIVARWQNIEAEQMEFIDQILKQ